MIIFHNPPPVWANVSQRFLTAIMRNVADLGKISSLFKKDIEKSGILSISSANPLSFFIIKFGYNARFHWLKERALWEYRA